MLTQLAAAALVASSFLVDGVAATYNPNLKNNTVVYWGQNGFSVKDPNNAQDSLWTVCNNVNVDIVVMAFVSKFKGKSGLPVLNLADQCGNVFKNATNPKVDTDVLNCANIGTMITQCQSIGKKILLSLGGATYNTAAWKDVAAARGSANDLWAMFGPTPSYPYRPFGSAVVDGFDLDFEHVQNKPNTAAFAAQMVAKFALDKKRTYMLTAAPQCPYPDQTLDEALTTVPFDAVFIQFYNNACGANTWVKNKSQLSSSSFNMQQWQTWSKTRSKNVKIGLYVGFLAGGVGTSTGYVNKAKAMEIVEDSKRHANFRGASFWDASILKINGGYLNGVKQQLNTVVSKKRDVEEREFKVPVKEETVWEGAEGPVVAELPKEPAATLRFKRRHGHHRVGF